MRITVSCFGVMREYLPSEADGNSVTIELPPRGTVADVADVLGAPHRLVHAVLLNEHPADLSSDLEDGDQLTLMPHYSGGAGRRTHG